MDKNELSSEIRKILNKSVRKYFQENNFKFKSEDIEDETINKVDDIISDACDHVWNALDSIETELNERSIHE